MAGRAALVGLEPALHAALAARLGAAGLAVVDGAAPGDGPLALAVLGRGPDRHGPLDAGSADAIAGAVEHGLEAARTAVQALAAPLQAGAGTLVVVAPLGQRGIAERAADSVLDAALAMLGRLAGVELAPGGARAVVLCPDLAVSASDVADAVAWVAEAPLPAVNGAVIPLDAARTATLPLPSEDAHA